MGRYVIRARLRPAFAEVYPNWSPVYGWGGAGKGWKSNLQHEAVMDKRQADVEMILVMRIEEGVTEYSTGVEEAP